MIPFLKGRRAMKRSRQDNEFLPAALEILENPASPVRIAWIWFISTLAAAVLLWTWLGTFDIVATAQGKVQPAGRIRIVQSLEAGRLVSRPMPNGTRVEAGEVLVALDSRELQAEETATQNALASWQAETARRHGVLRAVAGWPGTLDETAAYPADAAGPAFAPAIPAAIRQRERLIYGADLAQLRSSLQGLAARRTQHEAEIRRLEKTLAARRQLIATLNERVTMRSALADAHAGSRAQVIDAIEARQSEEAGLASEEGALEQAAAARSVVVTEAAALIGTFVADNQRQQGEAERRVDELLQQLVRIRTRLDHMTVRSPETGTIQASALTTPGQVVAAGTELMRIVPEQPELEIEAYLPNRDIGFVRPGQTAVIKVEAFPFTRYGVLPGTVLHVARDAIPEPDAEAMEQAAARELQSIIPLGNAQRLQNLVFPVTVRPGQNAIDVDGAEVALSPGMAVTIEIRTGRRRILEYLFSPLAQIASQAMHER